MDTATLKNLAANYAAAKDALLATTRAMFPHRQIVSVNSARYHGQGIVQRADGVPTDMLQVMIQNGNSWWYPVWDCEPVTDPEQYAPWIKILHNLT